MSFDLKSPVLKNITVVGFQLPINEVSSGHDSFVLGGQIQTQFRISSKVRLGLYGAGININRGDPIAVNVANGTLEQLKKIYTGAAKNWKDVGGNDERIILYGRENSSGTYAYFKEHVLENADYYPTTQTLPGTAAVINAVSKDIRGIGYGGIAYLKGVKALKVKKNASTPGVEPSLENVQKSIYPISRFLYWYLAGQPKDQIRKLTDWVLTAEGQSVINDVGYYPLPPEMLAKMGKK